MEMVEGRQAWNRKGTFSRDYFHSEKQTETKLKKAHLSFKQNYVVLSKSGASILHFMPPRGSDQAISVTRFGF